MARYRDVFDAAAADRWIGLLRNTVWRYFHPRVIGAEKIPEGRALIVGVHSGVMPYDATCLYIGIRDATGRHARFIGDRWFGRIGAMERFLGSVGAVVGEPDVLEALLEDENLVLLFPGGSLDMQRSYLSHRYRVLPHRGYAPGHGGYIKIALRTRSPIVPLAVVGAEEAHVMLGHIPAVARLMQVPFFPVVLFPVPMPTKMYIRFGRPIRFTEGPEAADDQATVDRLNEMVRRRVQSLITDTVRRRRGIVLSRYVDNERSAGKGRDR